MTTTITDAQAAELRRKLGKRRSGDIEAITAGIGEVLADELLVLRARLVAIDARLNEIENRDTAMPYKGVWQSGAVYRKGDFVTFDGAIWHCNYACASKPGSNDNWTLAIKSGRQK